MGYKGVETAAAVIAGEPVELLVNTRVMMITPENIDSEDAQVLLNPDLDRWLP
jgi:ABC-type sugar transport system substrate-binding protein